MTMKIRVIIFILVYDYLSEISFVSSRSSRYLDKRNELQRKINRLLDGKQGGEMLLDIDDYEYPRTNETLKQIHKQRWLDYYECLRRTYTGRHRTREDSLSKRAHSVRRNIRNVLLNKEVIVKRPPVITKLSKRLTCSLNCEVCISPAEMRMANLVEWYFNSSSSKGIIGKSIVEDTDHITRSSNSQYIVMYNLKPEQTGLYWCKMRDTMGSAYYLYIDSDFEAIKVVYPETAVHKPQATPATTLSKYKLYTIWTAWSSCSACDVVGIKLRYGYCTISLFETASTYNEHALSGNTPITDELQYRKREVEEYEWSRKMENTTQTTIVDESLRVRLRTTLLLFKNKLPCKSKLVPKQIRIISAIKNRRTEMMRRYCKKKCRKNIIFEVRDEKGNILESANNSAGIYSMVQGIPEPSPSIARTAIYERHNKKIKLACPGNLNANVPIIWQIDNKIIIPSHIEEQSNGRIRINPQMHIIFQSLKFEDTNVYSCWQDNELAGIIKLNVTGDIEFKLNHHFILIGAICIISIFLIIFWRAFKGRTRYTMH